MKLYSLFEQLIFLTSDLLKFVCLFTLYIYLHLLAVILLQYKTNRSFFNLSMQ